MAGQTIGTIKVQVGQQQGGTVRSINYGNRSIKGSTDLKMVGAQDGDVIVYQANTNSFIVEPAASVVPKLDAGEF
jgi:hypothetical protein